MERKEYKKAVRERLLQSYGKTGNVALDRQSVLTAINGIMEALKRDRITYEAPSMDDRNALVGDIVNDLLGWGPLTPLMEDENVTEIMVIGPSTIYFEKKGKKSLSPIKFDDDLHLKNTIERMIAPTGRRVDESFPYVDFSLEDGSRVNIILPHLSVNGTAVTIRKFMKKLKTIDQLIELGTLDKRMADFLEACIKARVNILFSGATGSGKTSLLEILSGFIDPEERVITIEDTLEMHLRQEHVVRLLTKPQNIEGKGEITTRDLFTNTLRMRPSRIILGEIRGAEALEYLQAMNSGHRGTLAVIHASTPQDVITRLETMVLYSGLNLPSWVVRHQIANGLDLIVQQEQLIDGSRKVTKISEISKIDKDHNIIINDLFYFQQHEGTYDATVLGEFKATGTLPKFWDRIRHAGLTLSEDIFREL